MDTNDTHNSEEKRVPKYRVLGESGLVEDEEGNILSASEVNINYEKPVRKTEDKSDPEYWYYEYNPRYCGSSREAFMEKMARVHARLAQNKKETTEKSSQSSTMQHFWQNSVQAVLEDKSNPAYWYYDYDPRYCGPSREAWMEEMAKRHRRMAKKKKETIKKLNAGNHFNEEKELGLYPTYKVLQSGMVFTGVVDSKGNVVVPSDKYSFVGRYNNGLAQAQNKKTKKWGFIDRMGNEVIPCTWRSVGIFNENFACVQDDNRKCGYVDRNGKLVIPCTWDEGWPFHEKLAKVQKDGKFGMIAPNGVVIIPCVWKGMGQCSYGCINVMNDEGKCGYLDWKGDTVAPCQWKQVWSFVEGRGIVQDFNNRLGYINNNGKLVIPCRWKKASQFNNGVARVSDSKKFFFFNKWVYIDREGRIVKE